MNQIILGSAVCAVALFCLILCLVLPLQADGPVPAYRRADSQTVSDLRCNVWFSGLITALVFFKWVAGKLALEGMVDGETGAALALAAIGAVIASAVIAFFWACRLFRQTASCLLILVVVAFIVCGPFLTFVLGGVGAMAGLNAMYMLSFVVLVWSMIRLFLLRWPGPEPRPAEPTAPVQKPEVEETSRRKPTQKTDEGEAAKPEQKQLPPWRRPAPVPVPATPEKQDGQKEEEKEKPERTQVIVLKLLGEGKFAEVISAEQAYPVPMPVGLQQYRRLVSDCEGVEDVQFLIKSPGADGKGVWYMLPAPGCVNTVLVDEEPIGGGVLLRSDQVITLLSPDSAPVSTPIKIRFRLLIQTRMKK